MTDPAVFFHKAAMRRCKELAQEVVDEIQASPLTPVDTGALKAGYHVGAEDVDSVSLCAGVDYWAPVEFGHEKYNGAGGPYGFEPAQPHVRPALEVVRGRHA